MTTTTLDAPMIVHAEPETNLLGHLDLAAARPCYIHVCQSAAEWVGTYSVCGCIGMYCDPHKDWWDHLLRDGPTLGCAYHDVTGQRFDDWRRL